MIKVKAIKDNRTLKYSKDTMYDARISQQCNSILFIENDLRDNIVVNKYDFETVSLKQVKSKKMKMILMMEGSTPNDLNITKDMIVNSLDTFKDKPIVFNDKQSLKDYTNNETVNKFNAQHCVGIIKSAEYNPKGYVEGNVIYYDSDYAKDEFDNWQIEVCEDKKSFVYCSAEVFTPVRVKRRNAGIIEESSRM